MKKVPVNAFDKIKARFAHGQFEFDKILKHELGLQVGFWLKRLKLAHGQLQRFDLFKICVLHLGKKVFQGYLREKQLDPQFEDVHVPQAEEVVQEELWAELLSLCRDEM